MGLFHDSVEDLISYEKCNHLFTDDPTINALGSLQYSQKSHTKHGGEEPELQSCTHLASNTVIVIKLSRFPSELGG